MVTDWNIIRGIYPFASNYFNLKPHRYHYLDEGNGENLLFLHGNPTWSFYYRTLTQGLKDSYRCIAPDHIGCGLSDKPQSYSYTLETHIDNLERFVDALELKNITLIMHDWGGAIGMGFAVRHPEKVKRLVIFNTAAFLCTHIPWRIDICRRSLLGPIAIRVFNAFVRGVLAFGVEHKERLSDQVRAGYLAPYDSFENRVGNLRFVQDIPMTPDIPSYSIVQNIETNLHKFRDRPMMIAWGKRDFCFNDYFLQKWCDYFPDAEVHEVRDAGHLVVEDAHEKIIPWMRKFLENNSLRT